MEQGATFRVSVPKNPTKDPHHRILAPQRSRFTHYYFYIRDETLGPMVMRVAFRKTDTAFLAVADVAAVQAAADKLSPQSSAHGSTTGP
jgi:hypothetical protein